jgi:hypothetical protein
MDGWSTFGERRVSGLLLVSGAIVVWIAAFLPITDGAGRSIYLLPLHEYPPVIAATRALWEWATLLLIAGAMASSCGAVLLSGILGERGEKTFSKLGSLTFVAGAALLVVDMAFRHSAAGWATEDVQLFVRLANWGQMLLLIYTVLTILAIGLYGISLFVSGVLPKWAAWSAMAYGALGILTFIITRDLPPFAHYVVPFLLGLLLLMKRSFVSLEQTERTGAAIGVS